MSNGLSLASWRSPADRRRAAILAGSIAFHVAVLAPMALGLFAKEFRSVEDGDPPPVFIDIEPRPLLDGETAREPTLAATPLRETAPAVGEAVPTVTRDLTRREEEEEEDEDQPTAPAPRIGIAPPAGAPPAPDRWQVQPEGMAAAVGRSMRTGAGGCRIMDGRLSASEQQLCDDRFNEAAGRAGPIGPRTLTPSEQRRENQFARDGAAAMAGADWRGRPARALPPAGLMAPDCPGGNLGGGCAGAHLRPGFEMTDERLRNNRKME